MTIKSRTKHSLTELGEALAKSLFELSTAEQSERPFVVVTDLTTRKFVQFASFDEPSHGQCPIWIDIPNQGFDKRTEAHLEALGLQKEAIDADCEWTWKRQISSEGIVGIVGSVVAALDFLGSKREHTLEIERGITESSGERRRVW